MLADNYIEMSFIRAKSHILRKEFAKAEEIYRDVLTRLPKKYPDAFIVWEKLGSLSVQIGKLDKAIKACMKCGLTWEKVNKRVYQVSHFYYPLGVIPRIGKEKKTCPRCDNK